MLDRSNLRASPALSGPDQSTLRDVRHVNPALMMLWILPNSRRTFEKMSGALLKHCVGAQPDSTVTIGAVNVAWAQARKRRAGAAY
jgi:hypothetical protein